MRRLWLQLQKSQSLRADQASSDVEGSFFVERVSNWTEVAIPPYRSGQSRLGVEAKDAEVTAGKKSQSLPTDQGSSDEELAGATKRGGAVKKSQSLPTEQGSSDGVLPGSRGSRRREKSQSLPMDQGSSDESSTIGSR